MLVAWVALVVSQTLPRCPAEQQPEWSTASALEKRAMVRQCAAVTPQTELTAPPPPDAPPPAPAPPRRWWRYRAGFFGGGMGGISVSGAAVEPGFEGGGVAGGFFGLGFNDWLELRFPLEITVGATVGNPFGLVSLGPTLVAWAGPVGFGFSAHVGAMVREYLGVDVAPLLSVRVRLGEQPRHEVALEGGVHFTLGLRGGDYFPFSVGGIARLTYTVSWGFMERTHRVALPAATGAE